MKIATYNFNQGGASSQTPFQVLKDLQPDILCAQELRSVDFYTTNSQLTWRNLGYAEPHWLPVPTHKQWGSAIFIKEGQVRETPIVDTHINGWLVGIELGTEHPLNIFNVPIQIFSFHTPTKSTNNYYLWQAQEMLEYIFQHHSNNYIILVGDFNVEISRRETNERRPYNPLEQEMREYIRRNLRLINCWQLANPNTQLISTYVGRGEGAHIDAIFISAELQHFLSSCNIIPRNQYQWTNADHCALIAEFNKEIVQFRPRHSSLSE